MIQHWRYLRYVLIHKWWVAYYGARLGVFWLALLHDNSKFRPGEFIPYSNFFYGPKRKPFKEASVYEKTYFWQLAWRESKEGVKEAFDLAWLTHQHHSKHHWQYWLLVNDQDTPRVLPMPDRYRREMLADWMGAGRAINGVENALGWYQQNKDKMQLHPGTRAWVEDQLGFVPRSEAVSV